MDINKRLNEIIFKYKLDIVYPQYRKRIEAEQFIRGWMQEMAGNDEMVLFLALNQDDIDCFSFFSKQTGLKATYSCFKSEEFKKMDLSGFDRIYTISMQSGYIIYCCKKSGAVCKCIYSEMEQKGLYFEREWYKLSDPGYTNFTSAFSGGKYCEGIQVEFFIQKQGMELADDVHEKMHYLKKLFFLSLYIKDFIGAQKYIHKINGLDKLIGRDCIDAWQEICILLGEIKKETTNRSAKDIIMIWMDAIGYEECEEMSYLNKFRQNGVDFENAFTVMAYTNETVKTIFCGTRVLDKRSLECQRIDSKNSGLIYHLENSGYQVRISSGYMNNFSPRYTTGTYHETGASCSEIFWDIVNCLANEEKPIFILGHALIEGHDPGLYPDMVYEDLLSYKERLMHSRQFLDQQMEYYLDFIGSEATVILMSDHGLRSNILSRSHTNLVIQAKYLKPKKISGIFSYVNFSKMLIRYLETNSIDDEELITDYAKLENPDYYNPREIARIISEKGTLRLFPYLGYQGYVTKEWIYVIYNIGKEMLARRDDICNHVVYFSLENEVDTSDEAVLYYFRNLPLEDISLIECDEKYKYSRYLKDVFKNYLKCPHLKIGAINRLFEKFEDESVALRMGGDHSVALYRMLSPDNRKKISCIIDRNRECLAGRLGYKVYTPKEMDYSKIKYVIPSSFEYKDVLEKEIKNICPNTIIVDVYEYLETQGVHMSKALFECEDIPDACYDVGFPFSEVI